MNITKTLENPTADRKSPLNISDLLADCKEEGMRFEVAKKLLETSPKTLMYNVASFALTSEHLYHLAENLVEKGLGYLLFSTLWDFELSEDEVRKLRQKNLAKSLQRAQENSPSP